MCPGKAKSLTKPALSVHTPDAYIRSTSTTARKRTHSQAFTFGCSPCQLNASHINLKDWELNAILIFWQIERDVRRVLRWALPSVMISFLSYLASVCSHIRDFFFFPTLKYPKHTFLLFCFPWSITTIADFLTLWSKTGNTVTHQGTDTDHTGLWRPPRHSDCTPFLLVCLLTC